MSEENSSFVRIVRGFPFPLEDRFTLKNIEDAMDLEPEDGDIIISSYPKTGTTWMEYIVLQILSKGKDYPPFGEVNSKIIPYIELFGVSPVHDQKKPRFYKTHMPYNLFRKNDKCKIIYTYRHPEDTVVSFYHFLKGTKSNIPIDFNQFFVNVLSASIAYGSYFEHVSSFYEHRDDDNLLMVSYENLYANRKEEILRIAKFLGEEHRQSLLENEELLNTIIVHTNFDYMKKRLTFIHPDLTKGIRQDQGGDEGKVNFFRKGVVGDGKAVLSYTQRQIMKEAAVKVLKRTSVLAEWYPDKI